MVGESEKKLKVVDPMVDKLTGCGDVGNSELVLKKYNTNSKRRMKRLRVK